MQIKSKVLPIHTIQTKYETVIHLMNKCPSLANERCREATDVTSAVEKLTVRVNVKYPIYFSVIPYYLVLLAYCF